MEELKQYFNNYSTICLIGKYGVGKDTYQKFISHTLGFSILSIKKILDNDDIIKGKYNGKKILIPDKDVFRVLDNYNLNGKLVNGFPRTNQQVNYLKEFYKKSLILLLELDNEIIISRLKNRLVCNSCFSVFNKNINNLDIGDKCLNNCGGVIVQQFSDKEDQIKKRINTYYTTVQPAINNALSIFDSIKIELNNGTIEQNKLLILKQLKKIVK